MECNARIAEGIPGTKPEIISIDRPFSIFGYLEERFKRTRSLHRIFSQARQYGARTIVSEEIRPSHDIIEENEDLTIRCPGFSSCDSRIWRISFFSELFSSPQDLKKVSPDTFLGYAVFKEDSLPKCQKTRVYESVIRPSRHGNNFIRGNQLWESLICGVPFSISGYLYAQQNGLTNVCAHVAARTVAARYHVGGDMTYREMNSILGIDHSSRFVGDGRGLTTDDLIRILSAAGSSCFVLNYGSPDENNQNSIADYSSRRTNAPYQKVIYPSIESGYPSLLVFKMTSENSNRNHIVPVFGHTFNEDAWVPSADFGYFAVGNTLSYIPSDYWLSMFIIHDDNFGSNYCLPKYYLDSKSKFTVYACITTLPKGVFLHGTGAEVAGADLTYPLVDQLPKRDLVWADRLRHYAKNKQIVIRPILVSLEDYLSHLRGISDWDGNAIGGAIDDLRDIFASWLSRYVWLVEISVPELFPANKRKLGEPLLIPEGIPSLSHRERFVMARLPGHLAFWNDSSGQSFMYKDIQMTGHTPLYGCES